jgi:hypothetical protein
MKESSKMASVLSLVVLFTEMGQSILVKWKISRKTVQEFILKQMARGSKENSLMTKHTELSKYSTQMVDIILEKLKTSKKTEEVACTMDPKAILALFLLRIRRMNPFLQSVS